MVIATPPNDFLAQYGVISSCVVMATIDITIRPYKNRLLDVLNGLIMMLIILVTVLPVFDGYSSTLVVEITLSLVIFPFEVILPMLFVNIKKLFMQCRPPRSKEATNAVNKLPMSDIGTIVDDEMRKNATYVICKYCQ